SRRLTQRQAEEIEVRARSTRPLAGRCTRVLATAFAITGLALGVGLATAGDDLVPYSLPVTLPADQTAPPVDAAAPYTPAVLSLIAQLESPGPGLTLAQ